MGVLILVLMEDTLRVIQYKNPKLQDVLILVLMEDTLRVGQLIKGAELGGLNPCFNGRYSQRMFSGRGQHTIR